jgi:hypothetical protein
MTDVGQKKFGARLVRDAGHLEAAPQKISTRFIDLGAHSFLYDSGSGVNLYDTIKIHKIKRLSP